MKIRANLIPLALVVPLGVGLFWATPAIDSTPITIGNGARFAILGDGPLPSFTKNNLTLGTDSVLSGLDASIGTAYEDVVIGAGSTIGGTVAASDFDFYPPPTNILLGAATVVDGQCATDGGTVTGLGRCKGGIDNTGNNEYITLIPLGLVGSALNQEECVDGNVLCQPVTETLPTINLAPTGKMTLTTTVPGLNVLKTPDIILASFATLTLKGSPNDQVILETPGMISLGPSSKIVVAGGLKAENVFITATTPPGFSEDPGADPNSRSRITTGAGVTIDGEIHAEYGCTLGANNTVNGAIVCDWGLHLGNGLHVNHVPMTLAMPQCSDDPADRCP
jgi:hypothetical protein